MVGWPIASTIDRNPQEKRMKRLKENAQTERKAQCIKKYPKPHTHTHARAFSDSFSGSTGFAFSSCVPLYSTRTASCTTRAFPSLLFRARPCSRLASPPSLSLSLSPLPSLLSVWVISQRTRSVLIIRCPDEPNQPPLGNRLPPAHFRRLLRPPAPRPDRPRPAALHQAGTRLVLCLLRSSTTPVARRPPPDTPASGVRWPQSTPTPTAGTLPPPPHPP